MTSASNSRKVMLSGIQPSNRLTIGNYIGALNAYVKLLNSPSGDRYFEPIALHAAHGRVEF